MRGYVYGIFTADNRKVYIGSTARPPASRWKEHLAAARKGEHHSAHFQRTYDAHGAAHLLFKVLAAVEVETPRDLRRREGEYLSAYAATHILMNGTQCTVNPMDDPEVRERSAERSREVCATPEWRERNFEAIQHRQLTPEGRARLSASAKAVTATPEWKEANRTAQAERMRNPAAVEAARKRMAALHADPAVAEKRRAGLLQVRRFLSPNGQPVTVTDLPQFCRDHGYEVVRFRELSTGKRKSYKGWRYLGRGE